MQKFEALLEAQYELADTCTLKKLRQKAWSRYLKLGLPTKQSEVFRYVKLRSLFDFDMAPAKPSAITKQDLQPYLLPDCSSLVFVNGHYFPSLSNIKSLPGSVSISSLDDASLSYGTFLSNHWMKSMKEESDPFAAINAALHGSAAFLYVPPKTVIDSPIQILSIIDNGHQTPFVQPRLQGFIGAHANINLAVTHVILHPKPYALNHVNDFHIEDGAKVSINQITYQENDKGWHFEATRANLKRNSTFHATSITHGSLTSRYDYHVNLLGENSETHLHGLSLLEKKQEAHHNIHIVHKAPHCRSNQLFKNCLADQSHSSFEGKIYVEKIAQKTEAYQLNANLLLNEGPRAESKPNLEIFADDVRASHGATFGQLDEEQIFYLRTRGLKEETAKQSLISGFCDEVIQTLTIPSLIETLKI